MNFSIIWFLFLAFCDKSISGKLPTSRNWYIKPLVWPADNLNSRTRSWPSLNTRYGKFFRSAIMTRAPNPITMDKYRSTQSELENVIIRKSNLFKVNNQEKRNETQSEASNNVYDFQQSYLKRAPQLFTPTPTEQILGRNGLPDNRNERNLPTFAKKLKYCRRVPIKTQKSPNLQIVAKSTLLPSTSFSDIAYNIYSKDDQSQSQNQNPIQRGEIDEQMAFKQHPVLSESSHSFFTLNDAVTPSFKNYQNVEKNEVKIFTPTIIPTTESKIKFFDYNETLEPSDSNTSVQRPSPVSTEKSIPITFTTEYHDDDDVPTESSLPSADATIFTTKLATTIQTITNKKPELNSPQNETKKRYEKKINKKSSARLALQTSDRIRLVPPRLKLKSKNEFFKQVRFGKVPSTPSSSPQQHETESNTIGYTEKINTTFPIPIATSTKPTKTSTKHMRYTKTYTSTIAAGHRIENNIQPTKATERRVSKRRNLKRFFKKPNIMEADKMDSKVALTTPTASIAAVLPQTKKEKHLRVEKFENAVKSTQSTIMKINGNKSNAKSRKLPKNSLESRRHSKEASEKGNVQPLPIEIFFQNQQPIFLKNK